MYPEIQYVEECLFATRQGLHLVSFIQAHSCGLTATAARLQFTENCAAFYSYSSHEPRWVEAPW